jgi:hypothetical protein
VMNSQKFCRTALQRISGGILTDFERNQEIQTFDLTEYFCYKRLLVQFFFFFLMIELLFISLILYGCCYSCLESFSNPLNRRSYQTKNFLRRLQLSKQELQSRTQFHNSFSQKTERFLPIVPSKVSFYR